TRKEEMQNLLELHQKELALLNEELEKAGQSAPGHANSTDSIKSEIEALKTSRRATVETVARNVPRTIALANLFPTPLRKEAEPELATLDAWKPSDEPREALQSIISILTKAHQFNRRFTRTTEIRDNREVEVLYLGLARAFYTDSTGNAGIGQPGTDGWTWQPRPEIHSQLTTALDTLEKKQAPTMVKLPLQIIER
ncbi:MAG: DUF3450 family protein, partial [Luteolibacter sp.]